MITLTVMFQGHRKVGYIMHKCQFYVKMLIKLYIGKRNIKTDTISLALV